MKLEVHELVIDGRYTLPDPKVLDEGGQILAAYIEQAPAYTGRTARVAKKWHTKFYEAALLARDRDQTPGEFTRRQLEGMARVGTVWPSAIACRRLQEGLDHNMLGAIDARYYKSQIDLFRDLCTVYTPHEILGDASTQLSAVVRLALATHYGMTDIADAYRTAGLAELNACTVAQEAFGDLIG